uniref:riboflavin kinase n=1 Tax=Angomonas desouzai TaxID=59800 RepID=T1YTJ8_9TRYP|nr:riboflavin kinase [Angomonas desouzai]
MKKWCLRGKVIHGFGRGGSLLGFPTANIELDESTTKSLTQYKNQVIFGWGCVEQNASEDAGPFPFAMSVGHNPQFANKELTAEVYFLHKFHSDFYDSYVRILCLGVLREQSAFTTIEELIKMIQGDCDNTQKLLKEEAYKPYEKDRFVLPTTTLTAEETEKTPYYKEL